MKRLGIIGGLGPETSCKFTLNVNNKFKQLAGRQPDILLHNLPISAEAEQKMIRGESTSEHLKLLLEAVQVMNEAQVDCIVIPCNTVHVFLPELRRRSHALILSIVEECARECERKKFRKVGLLASKTTVKSRLHSRELRKQGIELLTPDDVDQAQVNSIILNILNGKAEAKDKQRLLTIINELGSRGADGIILGCTDLPLLITEKDTSVPLINTCELLENAAVDTINATRE